MNREPHVVWKHIDGPMMACSDGQVHWLTWRERLMLALGLTTIEAIDAAITGRAKEPK